MRSGRLSPLLSRLLPRQPLGASLGGHLRAVDGILWHLHTGAPWRDLPERYGPWQTVYDRFNRWRRDGTWATILGALLESARCPVTDDPDELRSLRAVWVLEQLGGAGAAQALKRLAGGAEGARLTTEARGARDRLEALIGVAEE